MEPGTGTVWMMTVSRQRFHPLDPRPEEIRIEDIAHSLALQTRFGGHVPEPYSVAQHSVHVSERAERATLVWPGWVEEPEETRREHALHAARWGFLHDASEAYLVDVPRPLKRQLQGYKEMEDRITAVIAERFGLVGTRPGPMVKRADEELLATEGRDLFAGGHDTWNLGADPLPDLVIRPWPWRYAKRAFLARFASLFAGGVAEPRCRVCGVMGVTLCDSCLKDLVCP